MAWSWSHTAEAYAYARERVNELPLQVIVDTAAEWRVLRLLQEDDPDLAPWQMSFSPDEYERMISEAKQYMADWSPDDLCEYVWDQMCEAAVCDNGGWNAWVDPEGYVTVPFSPPQEG